MKRYCQQCHQCAVGKDSPIVKQEMKPWTIEAEAPGDRWHVDIAGPFTTSKKGNEYVLVMQDAFSKWPEAEPGPCLPNADVVIGWLDKIFRKLGVPKEIVVDQGSQVTAKKLKDWLSAKGVKHTETVPYHHQSNGTVERFNRTLEQLMRVNTSDVKEWDEKMESWLEAYRMTQHSATKKSPYEVQLGKVPVLPIDRELRLESQQGPLNRDEVNQQVREAIQEDAAKSKQYYDGKRNIQQRDLHNQRVYWKNMAPKPSEGGKLAPRFKGPYERVSH